MQNPEHDRPSELPFGDIHLPEFVVYDDVSGLQYLTHQDGNLLDYQSMTFVSTAYSFWDRLSTDAVFHPYCKYGYEHFWQNPYKNSHRYVIESHPVYQVQELFYTHKDNMLVPFGTQRVLFKDAGEYHSGLFIDENGQYFRASPLVIGKTASQEPVYDHRRYHVAGSKGKYPEGIVLIAPQQAYGIGLDDELIEVWKGRIAHQDNYV